MQEKYEIVYTKNFITKFKNSLYNFYNYDSFIDLVVVPFLWQKTLMYIPILSYSDRKYNEVDDLLELAKDNDYQIRTLNFDYKDFKKDDMVTMRLNVANIDEIHNSFSKKTRKHIRQANEYGFRYKIGNDDEAIEHFYKIYSQTMHRLGTPAFQKGFFYALRDEFKDKLEFYNFYDGYKIVASTCAILDEEIAILEWLGVDSSYQNKALGYFVNFTVIKYMTQKNLKIIDFGRSGYEGKTYKFKLHFKTYPVKIDVFKPKEENIYEKYQLASEIWKKLPYNVVYKLNWISKYLKDL